MDAHALRRRIRTWLIVFIVGLVLSGVTAFPLVTEVRWLHGLLLADGSAVPEHFPAVAEWLERIDQGIQATDARYPFLFYGTDWLAFAHLVIAVAFYGPYRDPVRNIWVVEFGMIACAGVIPLVLWAGRFAGKLAASGAVHRKAEDRSSYLSYSRDATTVGAPPVPEGLRGRGAVPGVASR